jgi:hypothetical protein
MDFYSGAAGLAQGRKVNSLAGLQFSIVVVHFALDSR